MGGLLERNERGQFVKGMVPLHKKPHIFKVCPECGTEFHVPLCENFIVCCSGTCGQRRRFRTHPGTRTGTVQSPDTREKMRQAKLGIRGPDHWNWRGGYARSERNLDMTRDEYIKWRKTVFSRDEFICQLCGIAGGCLHAHHIMPYAKYPELRYNVDNGLTLCMACHIHVVHSTPIVVV